MLPNRLLPLCINGTIAIFFLLTSCSPKISMQQLEKRVENKLQQTEGDFAVAFKDLTTGEQLLLKANESFHAASTMKTPVMIEVYRQAYAGIFSLQDSLVIKNQFKSIVDGSLFSLDPNADSEKGLYKEEGKKQTIYALMYNMIIVSSNLATNTIIEKVDAKNVTATMRTLGAQQILVLRGVEDQKAFDKGLNNITTAYDLMLIFEKMAGGLTVNQEASQEMVKILLDQQFNEIIPAKLPKSVKVAHKTGSITGVHHDTGIVFLPDGRKYVLVLLSKNVKDEHAGTKVMADVSREIYKYVVARRAGK